jgi:hypothetical protein
MRVEHRIGVARYSDDTEGPARLGNQGEQIISDLNPMYYEQTMRGNAFCYAMTTAASIVAVGSAGFPNLWNPLGSGKLCILTKVAYQVAAVGTPVITGFQYAYLPNAGAQVGTASPVLTGAYSNVTGVTNLLLGSGNPSVMKYLGSAGTMTVPTIFAAAGVNLGTGTGTGAPWSCSDDINGRIVIPPGVLFQIGASTATSTTFNISIFGIEIPMPLTA